MNTRYRSTQSLLLIALSILATSAFTQTFRTLTGTLITKDNKAAPNVNIYAGTSAVTTDEQGYFSLKLAENITQLRIAGKNVIAQEVTFRPDETNLLIQIEYTVPPLHDSIVIEATALEPGIERRDEAVYKNTLFSRDDQVFHSLNAGINAGQHEGGGKSLEIRRFGFNLDHGGVNGGLKVLVDNVQQNQGTQGHGQGYLGQLKSLTPELVQDVNIINGPFSAEYGDFSGLGVVHIRLRESLNDQLTARVQGGSFNTYRHFLGYSPQLEKGNAFIAYELSSADGPFQNPLNYRRDNFTGNYTWRLDDHRALGFRFNTGRNRFVSSGQLPLDEVAAGRLDRFGFLDPDNGGRVKSGVGSVYFRNEFRDGSSFKVDGFVARSLFDLFSNFTFFANDEQFGDEIQQHDSRLQQGVNAQYLKPFQIAGNHALFTTGANYHDNQINVGLYPSISRVPNRAAFNRNALMTSANARVTNAAGYVQQSIDLLRGKLHLDGGLRYDYFRFAVRDRVQPDFTGVQSAARFQPKANLAFTPSLKIPATFYFNYGRGIASQDARGVAQRPDSPRLSTTDFYQTGAAFNANRFSVSADLFLLDRSNEQVYIPDDGSIEFKGSSRAYGVEAKASVKLTRRLSFNAGLTRVGNAFYRGGETRIYVDSAPRLVANAGLTLADWHGFSGSLRYRHINHYRLDGADPTILASGFDVMDFSVNRRLRRGIEFNLAIDNLTNKRYYETQNFFESRLRPGAELQSRIHATPGYPITVSVGLTFRLFAKD
ncbi:MAG TPA: TonB-dependent receptor [Blastocatellia bacterium]|nr:TonB-dependent receptor [Blastocatellia bacterium]